MTKDKLKSLVKYQASVKAQIALQSHGKHAAHPTTYKQYLQRELEAVTAKIEASKLDGGK